MKHPVDVFIGFSHKVEVRVWFIPELTRGKSGEFRIILGYDVVSLCLRCFYLFIFCLFSGMVKEKAKVRVKFSLFLTIVCIKPK